MTNRTIDRPPSHPVVDGPIEHFVAEERRHEMLAAAARVRLVSRLSPDARRDSAVRRLRRVAGRWVGRVAGGAP
jgi:hypothetical protein